MQHLLTMHEVVPAVLYPKRISSKSKAQIALLLQTIFPIRRIFATRYPTKDHYEVSNTDLKRTSKNSRILHNMYTNIFLRTAEISYDAAKMVLQYCRYFCIFYFLKILD